RRRLQGGLMTGFADAGLRGPVRTCFVLFLAAAAFAATSAFAAVAPSDAPAEQGGLQEIVVTAQRRSEGIQNVPVAVNALSAQDLEQRGITGLGDLVGGEVPSLRMQPFAGNQTILIAAMRGISSSRLTDVTFDNPVPVYIDDVYFGRAFALTAD